ncbi:large ribosomal subunit protein mL45 [Halyomorpha halys]|uniref:large ribosomal subunit protein mL45 n=1 Tax=Halyomorpha halys TaxID=286706 RepID=UPI0006D4CD7A|nr:probable 39S ribosomal protein L45, mitochondrial [Halyomorpha halys]
MANLLNKIVKSATLNSVLFSKSVLFPNNCNIIYRGRKHWNPKFKKLRGLKFIKVKLPDEDVINKSPEELTKEQLKTQMKEMGILPSRPWNEKPVYISSTGGTFEPYVPPEGDGKVSVITTQGAKQKLEFIEKKSKSMMAIRKIRSFEEEFDVPDFLDEAQNIYINSYSSMMNKDRDKLIQFITERAYPEVVNNIGDKTIHWEFLESIELPRVVHVRCTDVITKENIFSQITVRFHTKQKLAIYDRFGRLMHGSETVPKDVLEYVVFEKHLANRYGRWRIHDKIIPDWMPPKEPLKRTFAITTEPEPDSVEKAVTA